MSKISQKQELRQKLTPKQILQANILQLNLPLLEQRILLELERNPALELIELSDEFENDENQPIEDEFKEDVEFDWEELLGEHEEFENPNINKYIEESKERPLVAEETISDDILKQLRDTNANQSELVIAEQVMGNLDEQGYLSIEPVLISDRLRISENKVIDIIKKIQHLEPPGLAARNIQECLLAQAECRNRNTLSIKILKDYFDDFVNHKYEKIIEKIGCSNDDLNKAMEFISKLNPSPRDDQVKIINDIIIPDISVEEKDGKFYVVINDTSVPDVRVSKTYMTMLKNYKDKKDVVRFVKQKVESANWFVDAIKSRKQTIHRVMELIIDKQTGYFNSSDRILKPMVLKDIAIDLNLDISTVSRVTNGKYVQLPWEIKELKDFFSEGIKMNSGDIVSSTQVKKKLKSIIELENKISPISDEEITRLLNEEGYKVARRTVAKYREQLRYPIARLRRKLK